MGSSLDRPGYDLLSLFYNVRLDALGPAPGGTTLRVMVLPTPEPKELVFHIGGTTDQGLKVMVNGGSPGAVDADQYFIFLNPERVRHPGLDPGRRLGQARGDLVELLRHQKGGAVGPAPFRFSRP